MSSNIEAYHPVKQLSTIDGQETPNPQEQTTNMSGRVVTKDFRVGLCKFITAIFFGVATIGTIGGGTGAFLLYESDKRLTKFPGDRQGQEDSFAGILIITLTFFTIILISIVGGASLRRRIAQRAAYQKIALEGSSNRFETVV